MYEYIIIINGPKKARFISIECEIKITEAIVQKMAINYVSWSLILRQQKLAVQYCFIFCFEKEMFHSHSWRTNGI